MINLVSIVTIKSKRFVPINGQSSVRQLISNGLANMMKPPRKTVEQQRQTDGQLSTMVAVSSIFVSRNDDLSIDLTN